MARRWWVNHKQTMRQEVGGGYLWSPKTEANGGVSQFYNNMVRAEPSDLVLSYADGVIAYAGIVTDYAITAPKPDTFGTVGGYWADEGWLLPVAWRSISPAIRPKDFIHELGPLLPVKYSPIDPETGNGRQKAYLAEISHTAFDLVLQRSSLNTAALEVASHEAGTNKFPERLDDIVERALVADPALDSTTKEQLIQARRGQGKFRANVWKLETGCRLTGITNPNLLIASHIKPWRACESSAERLDGANGLLMTPHIDLLFDRGFITFEDDGTMRVSPRLPPDDLAQMGLGGATTAGAFSQGQRRYLEYHRRAVFLRTVAELEAE